MIDPIKEGQAREAVTAAGQRLLREGLVARTWGNVSLRVNEEWMIVTPSGIKYPDLSPEKTVLVDINSLRWTGPYKPSGESKLHAAIYTARPEVGAIVHTHQNGASVFAGARKDLEISTGAVRCAPYALPGTKGLVSKTLASLGTGDACFLANHGALCVGPDLDTVFNIARNLEAACADHIAALDAQDKHSQATLPCGIDAAWEQQDLCLTPDGLFLSRAPFTLAFAEKGRRLPMILDDLAQLVGPFSGPSKFIPGQGALLSVDDPQEAESTAMVVEKSCRAVLAGKLLGGTVALPFAEALLMRLVYKTLYAKKAQRVKN